MCDFPIRLKVKRLEYHTVTGKLKQYDQVPCGKCLKCIRRVRNEWIFRIMEEFKHAESAWFVTLTYDDIYLPISEHGFPTLRYKDVQKFFKLLRRRGNTKLKYFVVGEYGSNTGRPHYHAILFNVMKEHIDKCWVTWSGERKKDGSKKMESLGFVHLGDKRGVTAAAVAYMMKYLDKGKSDVEEKSKGNKLYDPETDEFKWLWDSKVEFRRMSNNLGLSWLTERRKKAIVDGIIDHVVTPSGKPMALPRYYKKHSFKQYGYGKREFAERAEDRIYYQDWQDIKNGQSPDLKRYEGAKARQIKLLNERKKIRDYE